MSLDEKQIVDSDVTTVDTNDEDDKELVALGYKPSFKREFTNLATVRFQPSRSSARCLALESSLDVNNRSRSRSVSW